MKYLSVASGIEAATAAWHQLGFEPVAFSEIDAFPSAVLAHHYPAVPNAGDFTTIAGNEYGAFDILVGGTPCQSFSVAGKRAGMSDARGNLALEFVNLAYRSHPEWILWENVPGVLSSGHGSDFASFLAALTGREIGLGLSVPAKGWKNSGIISGLMGHYSIAWRVLDAQYCGVPQRRRRVFLVGHIRDWRRAAAVLFEQESLCWNNPPSRETGERVAPCLDARTKGGGAGWGSDFMAGGGLVASSESSVELPCWWDGGQTSQTLDAVLSKGQCMPEKNRFPAVLVDTAFGGNNCSGPIHVATACQAHGGPHGRLSFDSETFLVTANTLQGNSGRRQIEETYLPIAIQGAAVRENPACGPDGVGVRTDGIAYTLEARPEVQAVAFMQSSTLAFAQNSRDEVRLFGGDGQTVGAISAEPGMKQTTYIAFTCKDHGADAGDMAPTLRGMGHDASHANAGGQVAICVRTAQTSANGHGVASDVSHTIDGANGQAVCYGIDEEQNAAEDLMGCLKAREKGGGFEAAVAFRTNQTGAQGPIHSLEVTDTLAIDHPPAVCFESRFARNGRGAPSDVVPPLKAQSGETGKGDGSPLVTAPGMAVRRLTPRECERLQGFPDDYTLVPYRGKPAADGPRYKAIGNSMAVPVMRLIGERIQKFHDPQLVLEGS